MPKYLYERIAELRNKIPELSPLVRDMLARYLIDHPDAEFTIKKAGEHTGGLAIIQIDNKRRYVLKNGNISSEYRRNMQRCYDGKWYCECSNGNPFLSETDDEWEDDSYERK